MPAAQTILLPDSVPCVPCAPSTQRVVPLVCSGENERTANDFLLALVCIDFKSYNGISDKEAYVKQNITVLQFI